MTGNRWPTASPTASASAWPTLAGDLDDAHAKAVRAAAAGLADPALGALRLAGGGVRVLADAAVSSATPFLRAPLLARITAARRLHPSGPDAPTRCPECDAPAPCPTALALIG